MIMLKGDSFPTSRMLRPKGVGESDSDYDLVETYDITVIGNFKEWLTVW